MPYHPSLYRFSPILTSLHHHSSCHLLSSSLLFTPVLCSRNLSLLVLQTANVSDLLWTLSAFTDKQLRDAQQQHQQQQVQSSKVEQVSVDPCFSAGNPHWCLNRKSEGPPSKLPLTQSSLCLVGTAIQTQRYIFGEKSWMCGWNLIRVWTKQSNLVWKHLIAHCVTQRSSRLKHDSESFTKISVMVV